MDGACRVDDVIDTAVQNNMPAIAITDHGVMFGAIDFYKKAISKGIKPIIGCETYVASRSRLDRQTDEKAPNYHLVLLAKNLVGYLNLMRLVSLAHLEGFYYKPRIDREILARHHEGLIGLSACLKGEVNVRLATGDMASATRTAGEYAEILGKDNFFLEFQDHALPEQRQVNRQLKELSKRTGLKIVATNDVHYLKKEHAEAHEILLCLQTQTVMSDPKRMRYRSNDFYMKTRAEMDAISAEFPGATDLPMDIAEMCNLEIEFNKLHFPTFQVPKGTNQKKHMIDLGHAGLRRLYGIEDPAHPKNDSEKKVVDQFNHEVTIIEKTGFINYFLVVWDFVNFAHGAGIPVGPGRGSGGGSLLAYALGITAIDPLHYNLIFERFLNPERISPPDFDIDFCQARREEVINYVKEKYGRDNVAQIVTFGSLGPKTVIRDVGRVLELQFGYCDKLAKMVPDDPGIESLEQAMGVSPELKRAYDTEADCKRILDYGFVLEGLYRNIGTHAAGVVIGEKPLIEIIPLARDKDKQTITQYSMEPLGEIGLLKMDFLGLKTLTVINEAIGLIKRNHGKVIDLAALPYDDKLTYALFNRGDTVGVFQLESSGMRDLIRRVGIDRLEDLIAMIALYRPGPMNMLEDYVNRKTGKTKIEYDHPLLEPILRDTYGIMIYQEQVQQAANALAGYSLGEADILRRAMGKKKAEEMAKQRERFVHGCSKKNKINERLATRIFDNMEKFAGYGFNKAHSAGYGIIAYQTAFLKANYPAEFMAALLSSEIGNMDKLPIFMAEADESDIAILPPDVNSSEVRFKPEGKTIRIGLAGIKNVGEGASQAIVAEREKAGPFKSLIDFCRRVDGQSANKKVIESLVRCGAFDSMNSNRARLFAAIDMTMARAVREMKDRQSGQGNLFDLLGEGSSSTSDDLPDCPLWRQSEILSAERELLGRYMSGHPLTQYAAILQRYQLTTVTQVGAMPDRTLTRLGGVVSSFQKKIIKDSKQTMAVIQLEDLDGSISVVVFAEAFQRFGMHILQDAAIMVCGEVRTSKEIPEIWASEIYPLGDAPRHFATRLSVHIPSAHIEDGKLQQLKDILRLHPGPTPVGIVILFPSGEKVFLDADKAFKVLADEELIRTLEHLVGENGVYLAVNRNPCLQPRKSRSQQWQNGGRNQQ